MNPEYRDVFPYSDKRREAWLAPEGAWWRHRACAYFF
jgi:hypothetical protein